MGFILLRDKVIVIIDEETFFHAIRIPPKMVAEDQSVQVWSYSKVFLNSDSQYRV